MIKKNDKELKITVYDEAERAIEKEWNPLYFYENNCTFCTVERGEYLIELVTNGETEIYNEEDENYVNLDDPNKVYDMLDSGELYDEKKYLIDHTNWFEVMLCKKCDGKENEYECFDGVVFEHYPKSIEQLINIMLMMFNDYITNYIEIEKKGKVE